MLVEMQAPHASTSHEHTLWADAEVAAEGVHAGSGVALRPAAMVLAQALVDLQAARQAHLQMHWVV